MLVQPERAQGEERHWPGQVFGEAQLDYEEAMQRYVAATQDRLVNTRSERSSEIEEPSEWRIANQQQAERHQALQKRKLEDGAWKAEKAEYHQTRQAYMKCARSERKLLKEAWQETLQAWCKLREQRRATLCSREQENQAWHDRNQQRSEDGLPKTADRLWIAILVVTDNCTRQCLGLPLFAAGAKLTSQELMAALREVLPAELQFFISDQGAHFRTKAFALLASESNFIHVPVYRHRPESNGIAERFVLTLKNWLLDRSWQDATSLLPWLAMFEAEYNDRPHQGLAIPGLSPNEFASRIWLM
jgi:transposase InsO family protein